MKKKIIFFFFLLSLSLSLSLPYINMAATTAEAESGYTGALQKCLT